VFFRLNGQERNIKVRDAKLDVKVHHNEKAQAGNPLHVGSPLQGLLSKVYVKEGEKVEKNAPLFVIEAMKMENTVVANGDMKIVRVVLPDGSLVDAGDLVVVMEKLE
jgi:pyruvate carboxylase